MAKKGRAWQPPVQPKRAVKNEDRRNKKLNRPQFQAGPSTSMDTGMPVGNNNPLPPPGSYFQPIPSLLSHQTEPPRGFLERVRQIPTQISSLPGAMFRRRKQAVPGARIGELPRAALPVHKKTTQTMPKKNKGRKMDNTPPLVQVASLEPDIPLIEAPLESGQQVLEVDMISVENNIPIATQAPLKMKTKSVDNYPRARFECSNKAYQIVVLPPEKRFIFFGWCGIMCLGGSVRIDGFDMQATSFKDSGEMYSICAPVEAQRPALVENTTEERLQSKLLKLKLRLKDVTPEYESILYSWQHFKAAILIINRRAPVVVDLYKQIHENQLYFTQNHWNPEDIDLLESPNWHLYRDYSQKVINTTLQSVELKRQEGQKVTILPCGEKGSGKSTFVRYLCNRLLSSDLPLYLLDADIGQPEFTPSGCMSLWRITKPILDIPWCHQRKDFIHSYFFGDISPADDMAKYKSIFMRLLNEYNEKSEPGSVLIVNTLGWIDGPGREALQYMIDWSVPDYLLHMTGQQNKIASVKIDARTTDSYHIHRDIPLHTKGKGWNFRTNSLRPIALREMRIISYFSHLLSKPIMSTLCQSKMYRVDFSKIIIATPEDLSAVDDHYYLGTLNLQMIALCSTEELLPTRRLLDRSYLPLVCTTDYRTPLLRCYGYGIINAIDMEKRHFLLISPISGENLAKVTTFVRGKWLSTPSIITKSGDGNPAMYSMGQVDTTSGINVDLYSSLNMDRQNKFRRVHFPTFA